MQKITVIAIGLLYIAYTLVETDLNALSAEQFFQLFSKILFVLSIAIIFVLLKHKNWKQKIRLLTLVATLTFIFYNTSIQLQNFFEKGTRIFSEVKYSQLETMGPYVNFQIYYSLGKIVLLDLFAIFAYFAINRTLNDLQETNE